MPQKSITGEDNVNSNVIKTVFEIMGYINFS
jgi:hypothetical protein